MTAKMTQNERFKKRGEITVNKEFNVEGVCFSELHYMVDIGKQLEETKALVDKGKYFVINRARQAITKYFFPFWVC
jgi:hypothetical protein